MPTEAPYSVPLDDAPGAHGIRQQGSNDEPTVSAGQLLLSALRGRHLIARAALLFGLVVAIPGLFAKRTYTASATFVPDSRRPSNNLSGIAAQLGVPVPGSDPTESPQFYADLVASRELLRRTAVQQYTPLDGDTTHRAPLTVVLGDGPSTSEANVLKAVDWLEASVTATVRPKTGVIALRVTAPNPRLAYEISSDVLQLINQFNLETRQSRAAKERQFAEARLLELKSDLRVAEDALSGFLARNRDVGNIPDLAFQRDRLAREVQLRQAVYSTMVQSYEQARLDEVRDTPVITVVERPRVPLRPDPRGLALRTLFAMLLGALVALIVIVLRDALNGELVGEASPPGELRRMIKSTASELKRPWRLLVRHDVRQREDWGLRAGRS